MYEKDACDWAEFIEAMNSGQPVEIGPRMFDYWLNVLPPVHMGRTITLPSGARVFASFGFCEGADDVTHFYTIDGRHYCCTL